MVMLNYKVANFIIITVKVYIFQLGLDYFSLSAKILKFKKLVQKQIYHIKKLNIKF